MFVFFEDLCCWCVCVSHRWTLAGCLPGVGSFLARPCPLPRCSPPAVGSPLWSAAELPTSSLCSERQDKGNQISATGQNTDPEADTHWLTVSTCGEQWHSNTLKLHGGPYFEEYCYCSLNKNHSDISMLKVQSYRNVAKINLKLSKLRYNRLFWQSIPCQLLVFYNFRYSVLVTHFVWDSKNIVGLMQHPLSVTFASQKLILHFLKSLVLHRRERMFVLQSKKKKWKYKEIKANFS